MQKPGHKNIYLIPISYEEPDSTEWVWSDEPAPDVESGKSDAIHYIRANKWQPVEEFKQSNSETYCWIKCPLGIQMTYFNEGEFFKTNLCEGGSCEGGYIKGITAAMAINPPSSAQ